MLNDDIRRLVDQDGKTELSRLEADIWRREAALRAHRRIARQLAIWQGVVMAIAVIGSAAAGMTLSAHLGDERRASLMMPDEQFAPGKLLFGPHG